MKKLIAMMLAVMMVVGMTACASSNKAKTNDGTLSLNVLVQADAIQAEGFADAAAAWTAFAAQA